MHWSVRGALDLIVLLAVCGVVFAIARGGAGLPRSDAIAVTGVLVPIVMGVFWGGRMVGRRRSAAAQPAVVDEADPSLTDAGVVNLPRHSDVCISARSWTPILNRRTKNGDVSKELLRGCRIADLPEDDKLEREQLTPLDTIVSTAFANDMSVYVVPVLGSTALRAHSVLHFWTIMLVESVLAGEGTDRAKFHWWLMSQTGIILKQDIAESTEHVHTVWAWLYNTYLRKNGVSHQAGLLEEFLQAELFVAARRPDAKDDSDHLFRVVEFLLTLVRDDRESVRVIVDSLEAFRADMETRVRPMMLGKVKALTAMGEAMLSPEADRAGVFKPPMTDVPPGRLCPYGFLAMTYPLTVSDVNALQGRRQEPDTRLKLPYVFEGEANRSFDQLARDVFWIRTLCSNLEPDDSDWRWDIPTAAEWLTLAGCDDRRFPWGNAAPDENRANLNFGPERDVAPVGVHESGQSPYGIHDCCGGVNEIVRFSEGTKFPEHFRLAGGSYRTPPASASCLKIRPLTRRDGQPRRNIGLRLIRYRTADSELRWKALQDYPR